MPILPEDRYSRQILFRPLGREGQARLGGSQVTIVGCGATGSAAAGMLARAGVGRLRIVDRDYVEPSNLQRQGLFDENDAAESMPKAYAAARKIAAFNAEVKVDAQATDLTPANCDELLAGADVILDGTDNFETRYLLNDFAVANGRPWIYAAAVAAYAVTMNVLPGETACLACLFPVSPRGTVETCDTAGILNAAVHWVAAIQVAEAMKILTGAHTDVRRTLLSADLWKNEFAAISTATPRPDCPTCGRREFPHLRGEGRAHITLCGRNSVQIHEHQRPVSFPELTRRLAPHGRVKHNELVLKFWRDDYELTLFPDGRAIIKGTTDTAVARSLYARFIGS